MSADPKPFSNGSEERWWMGKWCDQCAHDHTMHDGTDTGCDIFAGYLITVGDDFRLPECWVMNRAQPANSLPALRMVCLKFEPCEPCGGDEWAEIRPALLAETLVALRERRS